MSEQESSVEVVQDGKGQKGQKGDKGKQKQQQPKTKKEKPAPGAEKVKVNKKNKKQDADAGEEKGDAVPDNWKPPVDRAVPEFMTHRIQLWEKIAKLRAEEDAKRVKPEINVVLKATGKDDRKFSGKAYQTTPLDIAKQVSPGLPQRLVVAKVDGELWDLNRPLEGDCELQLFEFESEEGHHAYWHSSAHLLGRALEMVYGAHLCHGPPIEENPNGGFYYDSYMEDGKAITKDSFRDLEWFVSELTKQKAPFVRMDLTKEEAQEMFKHNKFKLETIQDKVPDGERCSAYRCGPFIDLCKGPHVLDTGKIKAMKLTENSSAYWKHDANNESLQRVYGISFPDKKQLNDWIKAKEEAEARDHRNIGPLQKLFFMSNDASPGSAFFLPHGTRIYNGLMDLMRREYRRRGFTEVISPNLFDVSVWKTSGHYYNYKENMFMLNCEEKEFGLKPMNCPGHCLIFRHEQRSYRDLPVRFADFGVLHRNELSGALSGLTRVRRFQQDDAHIFCRQNQIFEEISNALEFLRHVYGILGFEFNLCLSTKPENAMGEEKLWEVAEQSLENCLNLFKEKYGWNWGLNPGDGAFYGPKIDIRVKDALNRFHQCATIQLDFQLPIRFRLQYKNEDGAFETPVIVHRAILGSVERMFAILIEHTGGKWPFWISPRQIMVVPVAPTYNDYARQVHQAMWDAGFYSECDDGTHQFKRKIRDAQIDQYNYILVVGEKERQNGTVNIRSRTEEILGEKSVQEAIALFNQLKNEYK